MSCTEAITGVGIVGSISGYAHAFLFVFRLLHGWAAYTVPDKEPTGRKTGKGYDIWRIT